MREQKRGVEVDSILRLVSKGDYVLCSGKSKRRRTGVAKFGIEHVLSERLRCLFEFGWREGDGDYALNHLPNSVGSWYSDA